jgi:putative component of toxin-antitoxin plasmid stabilization module|nr:MAG TPA: Receptor Binding Protein [Caudoviricetes sp.]
MICFPLDNTPYEAKDMGTYLATRTRGVFSSDGNLAVTPGESGLSVSVSPGLAWLKWSDYWGTAALQAQVLTLDLDTADGALKRIDAIVCRLDKVNNRAEIVVKKGAPSSAPIVVPPVRDANYDELYIATVLIGAGVISISASAITDQRLNEEYCGLMRDGVTGIPTASLHAQAQQILTELTDALNAQIVRQSAEFDAWFDDLKGKLGEDPATALQQQVDNLNAAVVGDAFQASGTPVSIAYAGTNRIASITAYGETPQGGTTEAPVALTGISSVTVNDDVTELPIPRPLRRVGDVKDKCVTRQEHEGVEKLVVTYNVGFVELDGTEDVVFDTYGNTQKRIRFDLDRNAIARYALKFSHGNPGDTPTVTGGISASFNRDVLNRLQIICSPDTWTALGVTDTATAKTWLAAQKAAGTPVQIAYQLATPETYATDPLDFDNAAGPLTVLTGGEVEVRMTELVGSRTYDADGDGVVDEAEKVSNALILKNAAGEVVATFDGSEAAILQLTAALVGALGKTEKAADSSKLAGLAPVVDNPGPNNRNTWYFPFTGTNNRDGTRKYYAALYADNATTAGRASNLSMGLNGTDLWVYYS